MVECHLLGSCRALLAQERKKVKRNLREMGSVCAGTSDFSETLSQAAAKEQPQPGWLTLQLSITSAKCFMEMFSGSQQLPNHLGEFLGSGSKPKSG